MYEEKSKLFHRQFHLHKELQWQEHLQNEACSNDLVAIKNNLF